MKFLLLDTIMLYNTLTDDVTHLPQGLSPEDLWTGNAPFEERSFDEVALSSNHPTREIYRILCLVERFVASGGTIRIVGKGEEGARIAASAFTAVHPPWTITPGGPNVVLHRDVLDQIAVRPTAAPRSRRVVSVAAFGDPRYWKYLPGLVRAHHALFPDYELRVHHDDGIFTAPYGPALLGLERRGLLTLRRMAEDGLAIGKCQAMLWRLAPAWDADVDYVFCRDLDSLPTWEDHLACEEFIQSGLDLHTIHAQPVHAGVMGGLSGFRAAALRTLYPSLDALVEAAGETDWSHHGADQDALNTLVAPKMPALVHSLFALQAEDGSPLQRSYLEEKVLQIHGVKYAAAPADDPRVPPEVREAKITAYPGAADYDLDRAVEFFNHRLPMDVLEAIHEAEESIAP